MTTAEMAQQILLWIRKMHTQNSDLPTSETAMQDRVDALVDDIETLCKEQLGKHPPALQQPQPMAASMPGLTEGRMCHYTAYNGRCLAALIIGHAGSTADLAVFTNLANVNGVKNFGTQFHQEIAYSEESKPGTWHWIERA